MALLQNPRIEIDREFFEEDLRQMTLAVNYLGWQFGLFKEYVTGDVLEIGGGIGNFTTEISRQAKTVISLEPDPYCFNKLQETTRHLANVTVHNIMAEQIDLHLPPEYLVDTVVCLNVLEHIEDDRAALRSFHQRLKTGGSMILIVPALTWLYGEIDRRVGHYRRYSKKGLETLILDSGLRLEKLRYFNFVGILGWLWNIKVAVKKKQSLSQIVFFDRYIVPWLSVLEDAIHLPFGQSLLAVCRK